MCVREQLAQVEAGLFHLVVGTHALVQGDVALSSSASSSSTSSTASRAAARDAARQGAAPRRPPTTVMPIPRTLALTVYGDLDVSMISASAPGRRPTSRHDGEAESRRDEIYQFVREQLERVEADASPLVEESAKIHLEGGDEMADHLQQAAPV